MNLGTIQKIRSVRVSFGTDNLDSINRLFEEGWHLLAMLSNPHSNASWQSANRVVELILAQEADNSLALPFNYPIRELMEVAEEEQVNELLERGWLLVGSNNVFWERDGIKGTTLRYTMARPRGVLDFIDDNTYTSRLARMMEGLNLLRQYAPNPSLSKPKDRTYILQAQSDCYIELDRADHDRMTELGWVPQNKGIWSF